TAVSAKLMRETEMLISESVENGEDEGINTLVKTVTQTVCADCAVKQIYFTEDIRLTDEIVTKDSRLIRWESDWTSKEVKPGDGKVQIKGTAEITAVFADKGFKSFYKNTYSIPFSQSVECDALSGDFTDVNTLQNRCYLTFKENEEGALTLTCELGAAIGVSVFRDTSFDVLTDAYSTLYECEFSAEKCDYLTDIKLFGDKLIKEITVRTDDDIINVADSCFTAFLSGQGDGDAVYCTVYILAEDGAGELQRIITTADIKTSLPEGYDAGSVSVKEEKMTVTRDVSGVNVLLSVCVSGATTEKGAFSQVTELSTDTSKPRVNNAKGNLVVKRLDPGETVWDAAKKYGTTKSAVLNANALLSDSDLPSDRLLLIPLVK
ncbi:MAG: DUF3794 domain-containing protein, partial [Clostridia bacterium]|nr:DUF3794 domain-containing protein [Clostridia bacterium]